LQPGQSLPVVNRLIQLRLRATCEAPDFIGCGNGLRLVNRPADIPRAVRRVDEQRPSFGAVEAAEEVVQARGRVPPLARVLELRIRPLRSVLLPEGLVLREVRPMAIHVAQAPHGAEGVLVHVRSRAVRDPADEEAGCVHDLVDRAAASQVVSHHRALGARTDDEDPHTWPETVVSTLSRFNSESGLCLFLSYLDSCHRRMVRTSQRSLLSQGTGLGTWNVDIHFDSLTLPQGAQRFSREDSRCLVSSLDRCYGCVLVALGIVASGGRETTPFHPLRELAQEVAGCLDIVSTVLEFRRDPRRSCNFQE